MTCCPTGHLLKSKLVTNYLTRVNTQRQNRKSFVFKPNLVKGLKRFKYEFQSNYMALRFKAEILHKLTAMSLLSKMVSPSLNLNDTVLFLSSKKYINFFIIKNIVELK